MTTVVVNNDKLIEHMAVLGFSEYEARVYAALLVCESASAYELARHAAVPTSKIYQVLARLESRGLLQAVEQAGRKRYIPLDAERFIAGQRTRMETTLKQLRGELGDTAGKKDVSYIWNLRGYEALIDRARSIIAAAEASLLISLWPEEFAALGDEIRSAAGRGLRLAAVVFGRLDRDEKTAGIMIHAHPIQDTLYAEKGGRGLSLVADSREALTATVSREGAVEGAWSLNAGFATLAEDYIKHDIYIMKVVGRFDEQLVDRFGPGYRRLRDVFTDEEE